MAGSVHTAVAGRLCQYVGMLQPRLGIASRVLRHRCELIPLWEQLAHRLNEACVAGRTGNVPPVRPHHRDDVRLKVFDRVEALFANCPGDVELGRLAGRRRVLVVPDHPSNVFSRPLVDLANRALLLSSEGEVQVRRKVVLAPDPLHRPLAATREGVAHVPLDAHALEKHLATPALRQPSLSLQRLVHLVEEGPDPAHCCLELVRKVGPFPLKRLVGGFARHLATSLLVDLRVGPVECALRLPSLCVRQ